ncbi:hypothetical protein EW095_17665 [Vibrio cholerae]|nr:hypothetical protein [Vibrio cholerae]OXX19173.1 hypothetical protein B9J86_16335 [Vibrio sp. V06_P1A73T115]OXX36314.1 hypothetical protein B9J81_06480 [Vibrio sp. V04_P4A5T148]OXX55133.1 hypothetical protein B9J91_10290 [Vibrio sp. V18_P1S4T112]OXX72037.1 hypothetical protein B9J87_09570 [Vibrio sp. V19_P1S1T109]
MVESINENLTVNVECPFCQRILKNRGLKISSKAELIGRFEIHCIYCNAFFDVYFDTPEDSLTQE